MCTGVVHVDTAQFLCNKQTRQKTSNSSLHLAPTIWVSMSQCDQPLLYLACFLCGLEKKHFTISPEPQGSTIFLGLRVEKIGRFILPYAQRFLVAL